MKNGSPPALGSAALPQAHRGNLPAVSHAPLPVELHIDQLVLDGFSEVDRAELGGAIQTEFARVLAQRGFPRKAREEQSLAQLDAGAVPETASSDAGSIAAHLVRSIYEELNP